MKKLDFLKRLSLYTFLGLGIMFTSCNNDDDSAPPPENEVEVITDVKLIFTPMGGGTAIEATAQDPDGEGAQELMISGPITLDANTTYTLTYEIFNNLETPGEDIGAEIKAEDDEHQIFYSFTDGIFTSPMGNGNIDTASDPINYGDEDSDAQDGSGNPVGLSTTWTTGNASTGNTFRAVLKHQPGVKTSTSSFNDGDTDFDLEFDLTIQ